MLTEWKEKIVTILAWEERHSKLPNNGVKAEIIKDTLAGRDAWDLSEPEMERLIERIFTPDFLDAYKIRATRKGFNLDGNSAGYYTANFFDTFNITGLLIAEFVAVLFNWQDLFYNCRNNIEYKLYYNTEIINKFHAHIFLSDTDHTNFCKFLISKLTQIPEFEKIYYTDIEPYQLKK